MYCCLLLCQNGWCTSHLGQVKTFWTCLKLFERVQNTSDEFKIFWKIERDKKIVFTFSACCRFRWQNYGLCTSHLGQVKTFWTCLKQFELVQNNLDESKKVLEVQKDKKLYFLLLHVVFFFDKMGGCTSHLGQVHPNDLHYT